MKIEDIRHAKLLIIIDELGGERRGVAELARRLGHGSTSTISQYKARTPDSKTKKPKGIGSTAARRIEAAAGKSVGWMDDESTLDRRAGTAGQPWQVAEDRRPYKVIPDSAIDDAISAVLKLYDMTLDEYVTSRYSRITPSKRGALVERIRITDEESEDDGQKKAG